ncbi:MAG: hypothetical protein PVH88_18805 [Ignavibacteria bacterium]
MKVHRQNNPLKTATKTKIEEIIINEFGTLIFFLFIWIPDMANNFL